MNKRLMFLRRVLASTLKQKLNEIGFDARLLQTFETAEGIIFRRLDGKVAHIVGFDDYSVMENGFCLYRGSDIAQAAEAFAINKEAVYA